MKERKSPVFSYYYPLTVNCETLKQRAYVNGGGEPTDETLLCSQAKPLFEEHKQPVVYTFDGNSEHTTWDDSSPRVMQAQIDLAQEYGVDGFIFDTYVGVKNGIPTREKDKVLDKGFLACSLGRTAYACMMIFGSPRSVLPVPPYFEEADRYYDQTRRTPEVMIDYLAQQHWNHPNYIKILDRPYVSVFTSDMKSSSTNSREKMSYADMIGYMKEYSWKKYKIEPYLATVCLRASHAESHLAAGADAMTGYGFLPDFSESAKRPLQNYRDQIGKRVVEWYSMQEQLDKPYVPPVVVGWDASPRGKVFNDAGLDQVRGSYPFTPIVTNSNSEDFGIMLCQQKEYLMHNIDPAERYTPITAWNEITEGAALLPKVLPDGTVDDSYLQKVKELRSVYGF